MDGIISSRIKTRGIDFYTAAVIQYIGRSIDVLTKEEGTIMPLCRVTLIANSGVMLECGGAKVFSDALHRSKTKNFSTVDEDRQRQVFSSPKFQNADAMIFTHKHPDHYSYTLIGRMLEHTPGIKLISPVDEFENMLLLDKARQHFELDRFSADFARLLHDGEKYADLPHYGYLLDFGGFTVFTTGDSMLCEPQIIDWLVDKRVDLALLNFTWLTKRRGREFITRYIKPRHLMFFHIPFAEDNISGYREFSFKRLPMMTGVEDVRLLCEPFQVEEIF